jgi:hypothetical protein
LSFETGTSVLVIIQQAFDFTHFTLPSYFGLLLKGMTVAKMVDSGRSWLVRCLLLVFLAQGIRVLMFAFTGTVAVNGSQETKFDENVTSTTDDDFPGTSDNANHSKPKLQAFYNMFIPPSDEGVIPWVRDLISEQLTQIAESYAASAFDLVIHIVSMGQVVDDAWIANMCATVMASSSKNSTFQCVLVAQYPEGDEVKTLTRVHDYCLAHESELVLYFHDKGSFHPSTMNDNWRRAITAALSSDLCLTKMIKKDMGALSTCDTCSLLFDPFPGPHYPGNMFAARCSYIAKLLSIPDYQQRHQVVDNWIQDQIAKNIFVGDGTLVPFAEWAVGRGRFESEHWLAKHPSMRPCDVATNPSIEVWHPQTETLRDFGPNSATRFEWSLAPRFPYEHPGWFFADMYALDTLNKRPAEKRMCDYFLLRGLLYQWMAYYNTTAHDDSWVWKWFPDGDYWRTLVATIGPAEVTHERYCQNYSLVAPQ